MVALMQQSNSQQSPSEPVQRLAYSAREVCSSLGISPVSLWRLEKRGLIHSIPHLRVKLFSRKELDRFLADTKGGAR
jgi:hypothetical protein